MVNVRKKVVAVLVAVMALAGLSGTAAADTSGAQRFLLVIVGEDDPGRVIAFGPITSVGTFQEIDEENVAFVFPEGTIFLHVPNEEESENFNERTCSGSFSFSGPWTITSGTGDFEDATGSGTFSGRGRFIGVRTDEGCSEEEGFFSLIVRAQGEVDLGGQAAA